MGHGAAGDRRWLEMHGGKWRITYSVPAHLQEVVGATKIKRSLKTDSLTVANELKFGVIDAIKEQLRAIERGGKANGERTRVLREAAEIASDLRGLPPDQRFEAVRDLVQQRVLEILGKPVRQEMVRPLYPEEGPVDDGEIAVDVSSTSRQQLADQFVAVALQGRNPIDNADAQYKERRLRVSPRTRDDHDRALRMLAAFCIQKGYCDDVAAVDDLVVAAFIAHLENTEGMHARTIKKFVSRLNLYFAYLKSLS